MNKPSGPNVLIVAPNASSRMGGEAFLPLKYFQILRQRGLGASLIAHARNRADLEEALSDYRDDIHYIEDSRYHRWIWKAGRRLPDAIRTPLIGNLVNQVNEVYQKRLIRKLLAEGKVDLIHQPIPVSPRAPSRIYGLGVPVVIGPMNGNMDYPEGYEEYENRIARMLIPLGRMMAKLVNVVIPGKRRADVLLVANDRTRDGLPFDDRSRVITLTENGVDLSIWQSPDTVEASREPGVLRLVFMGRLIPLKALDVSLRAIRLARDNGLDVSLQIMGDGPERPDLENLVAELGLSAHVTFHGFLRQEECAQILARSDALLLNSLRECGGAVVLEAMSLGKPVIAADWGGPADYLDSSCGILVHPVPRHSFADRLAQAISDLANDPQARYGMGEAGRHKIKHEFDWEKKIDRILEIYQDALASRN
ncbi:glycosyltransferase family 4 protein [Roseovarius sp. CAU 1744]|uniref:glycosyltransferase family 4 protein n=1 Tax=Roseovarius sp. CAU 1744 TaxID=3140368 RepID=UPI00325A6A25